MRPHVLLLLALASLASACVEDAQTAVDAGARDVSVAREDVPADAGCFVGTPRTRLEFLNRCTDAEVATKAVVLPLLRADGTLPPLP